MMPAKPSSVLKPADIEHLILKYLPTIQDIAQVAFEVAFNIDSSDVQIHHWMKLADMILQNYNKYDGFVIIHGTDSMVYTACALSFMLKGLSKPIILTGSQRPLAVIRSDARSNLINSIELATNKIPEVCIFFGTKLFRGNRAIKISSTSYEAFVSPNFPPLAEVGLDITLSDKLLPAGNKIDLHKKFKSEIFCIRFHPGLYPEYLNCLLTSEVKAVVIQALGMGNVAIRENSIVRWIEQMKQAKKIVVINSENPYSRVNLNLYEGGKMMERAGAISAGDMTTAATIVKLMYLLGKHSGKMVPVEKDISQPIAGEITNISQ